MTTVIYYKDHKILKTGNFFWVLGMCYKTLSKAKKAIDNTINQKTND